MVQLLLLATWRIRLQSLSEMTTSRSLRVVLEMSYRRRLQHSRGTRHFERASGLMAGYEGLPRMVCTTSSWSPRVNVGSGRTNVRSRTSCCNCRRLCFEFREVPAGEAARLAMKNPIESEPTARTRTDENLYCLLS